MDQQQRKERIRFLEQNIDMLRKTGDRSDKILNQIDRMVQELYYLKHLKRRKDETRMR